MSVASVCVPLCMVYANERARERACQGDSESVPSGASVGVRLSGRGHERERASARDMYWCISCAGSGYNNGCVSGYVFYISPTKGCLLHMVYL
jgi:hypothetical protein